MYPYPATIEKLEGDIKQSVCKVTHVVLTGSVMCGKESARDEGQLLQNTSSLIVASSVKFPNFVKSERTDIIHTL